MSRTSRTRTVESTMDEIMEAYGGIDMDSAFYTYFSSVREKLVSAAPPDHTDKTGKDLGADNYGGGARKVLASVHRLHRLTLPELLAKIAACQVLKGATYRIELPDGRQITAKTGSAFTTSLLVSFKLLSADDCTGAVYDYYPVVND